MDGSLCRSPARTRLYRDVAAPGVIALDVAVYVPFLQYGCFAEKQRYFSFGALLLFFLRARRGRRAPQPALPAQCVYLRVGALGFVCSQGVSERGELVRKAS